jgi:integrase
MPKNQRVPLWSQANCEKRRKETMQQTPLAQKEFLPAAEEWYGIHSRYIRERTQLDYRQCIGTLDKFFHGITLRQIHIGHLREYQSWRSKPFTDQSAPESNHRGAGNHRINKELNCLTLILREANLWEPIEKLYKRLPVSLEGSGQSMSNDDQEELLAIALSPDHPKWNLAGHCVRIMLRSGVGFGELRKVRRKEVLLDESIPILNVMMGAKNGVRIRTIPLTPQAVESVRWILERWKSKGGDDPEQFILPGKDGKQGAYNLYKPMGSIQSAWASIRKCWGKNKSLRIYDCRVTAVTNVLDSGEVSLRASESLFGHVSQAMQKRYYKPQREVLRNVVDVLERKKA